MQGKRFWSIIHFIFLILLLVWNYLAQNGSLPYTMGEMSERHPTLFTPAAYAFSIWGIIYLGLMVFAVHALVKAFNPEKEADFVIRSAPLLTLAYSLMIAWVWLWGNELIFPAMICMLGILVSLTLVVIRLRMEVWDAPVHHIAFVWWPIDLLFGWINVATIANISVYLKSTAWDGFGLAEDKWTLIMLSVVGLLALFLIASRNLREVGAVFIWALIAIAVKHWTANPNLAYYSLAMVFMIGAYSSFHAFQNRETLPHLKMKRGEW